MSRRSRRYRARIAFLEQLEHRNLLVGGLAGLGGGDLVDPTPGTSFVASPFRQNVAVVKLSDLTAQGLLTTYGGLPKASTLPNVWQVEYPSAMLFTQALAALPQMPGVVYAEAMQRMTISLTPNDQYFNLQYGLHNTGQVIGNAGVVDADIDAPEAWDSITEAMNIVVADIDTGIDYRHPDLYQNIWINQGEIPASRLANLIDVDGDGVISLYDLNDSSNIGIGKISDFDFNGQIDGRDLLAPFASGGWANGVSDDGDQFVDDIIGWDFVNGDNNPLDDEGHGTHTTGTIAAMSNNSIGVAGVVWKTQVMALKFLDAVGEGSDLGAAEAIAYSILKGAKVSNNSWGGDGTSQTLEDAVDGSEAAGQLFIAAAGNDARNIDTLPTYPASYTNANLITVAATTNTDGRASFSNWGANSVDLGAPGDWIASTYPIDSLYGEYVYLGGTSMAAPHVAGAAVLLWSQRPSWDFQQVKVRLLDSVDPITSMNGITSTGGRLNLNTVVTNATPTDIALSDAGIDENQAAHAVVGVLSSTDADAGETFTYSLVAGAGSTDNGSFSIDGDSLVAAAGFDFETKSSYSIRVRTTDEVGASFEKQFTISVNDLVELTGLDVQQGQTQRSFIRHVDLLFADSADLLGGVANVSRMRLTRYDLAGANPVVMSLASVGLSASQGKISLDFGAQGITGNRNSNAGDGYFTVEVDLDGNGSFDAVKRFYRLLGDVNGDQVVNAIDASAILMYFGASNPEYDANGDGVVNSLDRTLAVRSKNRQLVGNLELDD